MLLRLATAACHVPGSLVVRSALGHPLPHSSALGRVILGHCQLARLFLLPLNSQNQQFELYLESVAGL